jgi:hypothetical protein
MADPLDMKATQQDRQALIDALEECDCAVRGTTFKCNFHGDRRSSGSIHCGKRDGIWRATCHVCKIGGDVFDWLARGRGKTVEQILMDMGKSGKDPFGGQARERKAVKDEAKTYDSWEAVAAQYGYSKFYEYVDHNTGEVVFVIVRFEATIKGEWTKWFKPYHERSDGKWTDRMPDGMDQEGARPLYNAPAAAQSDFVVVVEGEKCVEALKSIGVCAVTSSGGANAAAKSDWSVLAGKTVIVWPDADDVNPKTGKREGIEYANKVVAFLMALKPKCRKIGFIDPDLLGLSDKGDAADLLELYTEDDQQGRRAVIRNVCSMAKTLTSSPKGALLTRLLGIAKGLFRPLSWSHTGLSRLGQMLMPGAVVVLCGTPGSSKSFWVMQELSVWTINGVKAAAYMLENDKAYHLQRALAQIAGNGRLANNEWVEANAEVTLAYYKCRENLVAALEECIFDTTGGGDGVEVTLDDLADWVEKMAAEKYRVLMIDPVTNVRPSEKPWVADHLFLMRVKRACLAHGCTLILITHPKKGKMSGDLDDLAGGAAYQRFSEAVAWLGAHLGEPEGYVVKRDGQDNQWLVDRVVDIRKSRNGPGAGAKIAFRFDGRTLRFNELGTAKNKVDAELCSKPPVYTGPLDGRNPNIDFKSLTEVNHDSTYGDGRPTERDEEVLEAVGVAGSETPFDGHIENENPFE